MKKNEKEEKPTILITEQEVESLFCEEWKERQAALSEMERLYIAKEALREIIEL